MGQTETLQFPFAGGLSQKQSVHYLDPSAQLATVTDGIFKKANVVDKRNGIGFVAEGGGGAGGRLASWSKADLVTLSALGGAQNVDAQNGTGATALGALPPASLVRRAIPGPGPGVGLDVVPIVGDIPNGSTTLRVAAWVGPSNLSGPLPTVWACVYDASTQQVVLPATAIYTSTSGGEVWPLNVLYLPNAPAGEQLKIFIADTSVLIGNTNSVWRVHYAPATNTFSSATSLGISVFVGNTTTPAPPPIIDIAPFVGEGSGRYLVAYANTSTTYLVEVWNANDTLSSTLGTLTAPGGFTGGGAWAASSSSPSSPQIAVYGTATETIWATFTWMNAGATAMTLWIAGWNSTTSTQTLAPAQVSINGGTSAPAVYLIPPVRLNPSEVWFGWYFPIITTGATQTTKTYQGFGGYATSTTLPSNVGDILPFGYVPIARPFVVGTNGLVYLPVALLLDRSSIQGTFYLLQLNPALGGSNAALALPVATGAPRQLDLASVSNIMPNGTGPTSLITGPNHLAFGAVPVPVTYTSFPIRTMGTDSPSATVLNGTTGFSGLNLAWTCNLNFASLLQFEAAELGGLLYISGGTTFVCDGAAAYEVGFFSYPEFAFTSTSGTGTTLATGSYQYAIVYVYVDAAGNVTRGCPVFTDVRAITNGGAYPVVHFPSLVTWRDVANPGQCYAEIYRTTASPASPVYYLLDRVVCSLATPATLQGFFSYSDDLVTNTNAALQTSSILYTTGGVLDQPNPPASNALTIHKQRAWIVDDTLQAIWFSEQFSEGLTPGWNETLTIPLSDGGDITALAEMDSEQVVFKRNAIWVIYGGDGPNQEGTGSDIQSPQKVPSDVGCADWRSVVLTPLGLMFAAPTGIYLLDRSLGVDFIGQAVVDLFASFPVCVGAVLVPGSTQVRFAMQNAGGTACCIIVYDYFLKVWLQHTYAQQATPVSALAISQLGTYSVVTENGLVWQETNEWLDEDASAVQHFVPTTVTTAEIKVTGPGDLQRYQRVRVVQLYGDKLEASQITIGLAFNGNPAIVASRTWTAGQLQGLPYDLISMSVPAAYTRCMSVQVTLSDSADAVSAPVTGQGVRWVGLALEIEALAGRYPQTPKGNR